MKSTHQAIVVPVVLEKHPNPTADFLSVITIENTFTVVVRTSDWVGRDRGVYIQPQNIVDTDRPEFSFLRKREGEQWIRIKPMRLKGVYSYGLLIPALEGSEIGDDLTEYYNIKHWEPEEKLSTGGNLVNGGRFHSISKYDIDSAFKLHEHIPPTQLVVVTEKLHGANFRLYSDGETTYVGSRTNWIAEGENIFWGAYRWLQQNSDVEGFLRDKPYHVLYGEAYGQVQSLKYGLKNTRFAGFDIRLPNLGFLPWYDYSELMSKYRIPTVPYIGEFYHYHEKLKQFANGNSLIDGANHIKEGVVIRPVDELYHDSVGRLVYKIINPEF